MTFERRTLQDSITFDGVGLHSGEPVRATVHPGEDGLWFRSGPERVRAIPQNISDTSRCTRLGGISTIEHLMSALAAVEITDAEIEVEGGELPGMDGSSVEFVRSLTASAVEFLGTAELPSLFTRIFIQKDNGPKVAIGKGEGHWRFVYDLGDRWPGQQCFETEDIVRDYASQVAPARTLVLAEEIPTVQALGLGRGLDESSVLVVGPEGYLNDARFEDEPVRHKLLDLVGDLYLAGVPIRLLNVVAEKSGHRANVEAALLLKKALFASP